MCVDFTDLNKAWLKDSYPPPQINLILDSTVGHQFLSFMDVFSGYSQIKFEDFDQEKISFIATRAFLL